MAEHPKCECGEKVEVPEWYKQMPLQAFPVPTGMYPCRKCGKMVVVTNEPHWGLS